MNEPVAGNPVTVAPCPLCGEDVVSCRECGEWGCELSEHQATLCPVAAKRQIKIDRQLDRVPKEKLSEWLTQSRNGGGRATSPSGAMYRAKDILRAMARISENSAKKEAETK